jgi:NAD(P)-dependent dehydrogenase (short-subunit alcohol dehydrogenase family)
MTATGSGADPRPTAAIVTGAGQGIGAAEAEQLVASGRTVVLNDIDADLLEKTAKRLGGPEAAIAVPGDISKTETAKALVAEATRDGRRLDAVINNAGVVRNAMISDVSDEDFDQVVAVNLRGTFMLSREAAKYWREQAQASGAPSRSTLVSTTSRAAILANPGQTNYGASKAGVAVMTQILARELRPYGVRCNVIAPRAYTRMMWEGVGAFKESVLEQWSPDHVGRFAVFLCGPGGDGITGQIFVVHGPQVSLVRTWAVSDPAEVDYEHGDDAVLQRLGKLFAGDPMEIPAFEVDDLPLADPHAPSPFRVEMVTPPSPTMT